MHARIGDRLRVQGKTVGVPERVGEIVGIRHDDGSPPYLVRFGDGHEALVVPGPDCLVVDKD